MGTQDRRNSMGLDEAFHYWRSIETGQVPSLFKIANALHTIDLALQPEHPEWQSDSVSVTKEAWSSVRSRLFEILITRFGGYFLIYGEHDPQPLPAGSNWPLRGRLEFYPDAFKRRTDSYEAAIDSLMPAVLTVVRLQFAHGEQTLKPDMFEFATESLPEGREDEVNQLFHKLYQICEREAEKGKKRAQRTWYHTLCETRSCRSKEQRRQLLRKLNYLESVWGCRSSGA